MHFATVAYADTNDTGCSLVGVCTLGHALLLDATWAYFFFCRVEQGAVARSCFCLLLLDEASFLSWSFFSGCSIPCTTFVLRKHGWNDAKVSSFVCHEQLLYGILYVQGNLWLALGGGEGVARPTP